MKEQLNAKQREAVKQVQGPLLIVAGAGSGKTRTITHRMAHMIKQGISQNSILGLTFTNKAAKEMAERIRALARRRLRQLTVCTFHALGVKILRHCIHHLGYRHNFSIYDQTDKVSLIRSVARELNYPPDGVDGWGLAGLISAIKTGRGDKREIHEDQQKLYREYQEHLYAHNAVDFDDLIVLSIRIFREYPETLADYRLKYQYLMVDEFQDTSQVQYELLKLLAERNRNLCVVGDDDQSIYSWRGANYQNIINFERDFPERKEIKLEQNYRSTRNILQAANTLIAHNLNRKDKALWTGGGAGKSLELHHPQDESEEAAFIAERIHALRIREKLAYHDFGVLLRTNHLTPSIEEAFLAENIPYRISGGTGFFQREEIKDMIAYLRVMANPDDDVALIRILNTPRRGIGKKTLLLLRETAQRKSCSLHAGVSALILAQDSPLSPTLRGCLGEFLELIEHYREQFLAGGSLAKKLADFVETIAYWGHLIQEHQKKEKVARWKIANVNRLLEMLERWEQDPDNPDPNLYNFLNRVTLISRDEDSEIDHSLVNLMTIHSAKGLEFKIVFLAGVEDHIIPHHRALAENPDNIEEERRLFYVALTRAREKLFLTSCKTRRQQRSRSACSPSRFLQELPGDLLEHHQPEEVVDNHTAKHFFQNIKAQFHDNEKVSETGG